MDSTDSDSDPKPKPIPKKRTRSDLNSPKLSPSSTLPLPEHYTRPKYQHDHHLTLDKDSDEGKPKPKQRIVSSLPLAVPSTSSDPSTSITTTAKGDIGSTKTKKGTRQSAQLPVPGVGSSDERIPAGGTGTEPLGTEDSTGTGLRIRDILQAFQDDVVSVKSPQRRRWQDRLDEILFPELNPQPFDTVTGFDRRASVPSKWKSAASLVPRDITEGRTARNGHGTGTGSIFRHFSKTLHHISFYCSGVLCGLLLWKGIFAGYQILQGKTIDLGPCFWNVFWTITTSLLLITVLGLFNRPKRSLLVTFLYLIPSVLIFITYYSSMAFSLQRSECQRLLDMDHRFQPNVHQTYHCDQWVAGRSWDDLTYWKISLDFLPAFGSFIVYTYLHCTFDAAQRLPISGSRSTLATNLELA